MNITYRKAFISDAEVLANTRLKLLEEDSGDMTDNERIWLYQNNKNYILDGISKGSYFAFLAFDGETFVGTCSVCLYSVLPGRKLPNGKNAYLQNMFVTPQYRRRGIGRSLVYLCINEALKLNHDRITLHATQNGQQLFLNCGFKTPDKEKLLQMVYE